ncbi:MAG TPA: ABC transporter ATP-binding protein [Roseiflexaceae bacterium]|nr:ABC transporter ATP-binding protein [Roseiflexaceae bacterium]
MAQPSGAGQRNSRDVVLSVRGLEVEYRARRGLVKAVQNVSFDLHRGESITLVGESGCGKTTLGLSLVRLLPRQAEIGAGQILYQRDGRQVDVVDLEGERLRQFRWAECAMVFQGAQNSFNPVLRIWDQIWDTISAHGRMPKAAARSRALELLSMVQLEPRRVIDAYPHELSGGMRQRVLIAMSLLLNPQVLILDEPTTALDVLTQRTVIEVLRRLKEELGFAMIFITHDLAVAAELADRVATMYAGRIIEIGPVTEIFYRASHPYSLGLIRAVPTVTGEFTDLVSIEGSPPDLISPPPGCKFHPRCPYATQRSREEEPELVQIGEDHFVACHNWQAVRADTEARRPAAAGVEGSTLP